MSVPNEISSAGPYLCDGLQKEFPFEFPILDPAHIAVYRNLARVTAGFSVEPLGEDGGTVLFDTPPAAGSRLVILRDVPITQLTDIQNNTAFLPEILEDMADKLTMICQQLREMLSRVVIVPPGVDPSWEELMELLTSAGADAQAAAQQAQEILDWILSMGIENLAPLDSPAFVGMPTAPTAGQGTNTGQLATTAFVQNELTDMLISTKVSFLSSQWLLDSGSGQYYLDVVTQASMFNHVYKAESGGSLLFDDSVEVHMKDEGYIHLVSTTKFDGYMHTLAPRRLPTFSFSPITADDGSISGLRLNGLMTNPMNVTEFHLPSSAVYDGKTYSVKEIAESAFAGNSKITKIVIGDGVRKIGERAFRGCNALTSIELPSSMRELCNGFIYSAPNLKELTLNDGLLTIRAGAFILSMITELRIPESVTYIEEGAFAAMNALEEITVAAGNAHYKSIDGCAYSKDGSVFLAYAIGRDEDEFTVAAGTARIGGNSFQSAVLDSVTIPDGCLEIGKSAFFNAVIGTVSLPGSIVEIETSAFDCTELETITLRSASSRYSVDDGVLYDTEEGVLLKCPSSASAITSGEAFAIPGWVTTISSGSLRGLEIETLDTGGAKTLAMDALRSAVVGQLVIGPELTEFFGQLYMDAGEIEISEVNTAFQLNGGALLTIDGKKFLYRPKQSSSSSFQVPAGVETICRYSVNGDELMTVTLPDSCTSIESYGIASLPKLTTLNLGAGMKQIVTSAISGLNLVTALTFPETIQTIGPSAIDNLPELTDVTFLGTGTWTMTGAFFNCPKLLRIHGYAGSTAEAFAAANNYLFSPLE